MALLPACKSRAALVYSLLLASACIEISRTCEGKKLIRIVEVLDEIKDWKKLAMQLDMKQGVINKIGGWDDVVRVLCDLKGDVPVEDVVATIAEALREIGNVKQADKLEQEFPGGTVITSESFTRTKKPPVVPNSEGSSPLLQENSVKQHIKQFLINLATCETLIGTWVSSLILLILAICF